MMSSTRFGGRRDDETPSSRSRLEHRQALERAHGSAPFLTGELLERVLLLGVVAALVTLVAVAVLAACHGALLLVSEITGALSANTIGLLRSCARAATLRADRRRARRA